MGWTGCVRREKSRRDFVARAFALIALVHPVLHRVSCGYETIPNAPKHEFHASVHSVLIAPVHSILHQVSCSYETIANAPKDYATHKNMSLGSNGVDWVRSLQK